jgi:hypothetical protein
MFESHAVVVQVATLALADTARVAQSARKESIEHMNFKNQKLIEALNPANPEYELPRSCQAVQDVQVKRVTSQCFRCRTPLQSMMW